MAKVQIKSEELTPFGGIFSIMEQFDSMLSPIIDQALGQRCRSIIRYQYSEIIRLFKSFSRQTIILITRCVLNLQPCLIKIILCLNRQFTSLIKPGE